MKNHPIVIILLSLVIILSSCEKEALISIEPSSNITTEARNFSDYNQLNVSSEFQVFLTFSDTEEKIEVEANENLQSLIIVEKQGETLNIRMRNNTSIKGMETTNIHITTKEILDYNLSGEVELTLVNEMTTEEVAINLTGESTFTGAIQVEHVETALTGEAELNLTGTANTFSANLSGESQVQDYDFVSEKVDINLTGDSKAYLTVTDELSVTASGESELHYKGTGSIKEQVLSGEAKIKKED